jgi:tetratricopeptide (TPR) repeat protein
MTLLPSPTSDPNALFQEALLRLLNDEMLAPFCDWFSAGMLAALQAERAFAPSELDEARRYQQHMARQLWGHVPVPSNRWRARGLPKVERNGPCHCGSGRKYKQCCSAFEHEPLPMPVDALMVMALGVAGPEMLTPEKLRQIPAQALGEAAMNWNEEGLAGKTRGVLGPVFENSKALDERHEMALDALVDAMQSLGQDRLRHQLLEQMSHHTNKALATAARCRLVSVLADQGEDEKAWKLFHETSRFNPNDPQLWPLELTLLLSQGRREEALLRVPLLMARARQAGLDDLADALARVAKGGMEAAYAARGSAASLDDPVGQAWLDLASATPDAPDTEALLTLYKVDRFEPEEKGKSVVVAAFKPAKKLADLNLRWRRRFMVGKPEMTSLHADVETLLGSLPEALTFLGMNPAAWLSAEVLDDLLLAAMELCEEDAPSDVVAAARRVADHALAVMQALAGGAQLHWIDPNTRPLLRCLAVAVELARMTRDTVRAMDLLRMGLALNPNDNHGWRAQLAPLLIEDRQYPAALALFAQYPDDMPPSEHLHALALFGSDKKDEAEAMLREAHKDFPLFLNFLLPDTMDAPPDEPGPGIRMGGTTAAWYHRIEWRAMWVRSGALAWAKGLKLPEPPARRKPAKARKPTKFTPERPSAAGTALGIKKLTQPFGTTQEKRLQKTCSDYPRLHGLMLAMAWSPQMLMPNTWLPLAMALHDRMPKSRTEATANKALNDALGATMQLYNHVNQDVLDNLGEIKPPLLVMLSAVTPTDEAAFSLAAGFITGCETAIPAWARSGHKVTGFTGPFGRLRALAARAPMKDGQRRVQQDNGSPLLQSLAHSTPAPMELAMALADLWPAVVAGRLKMR